MSDTVVHQEATVIKGKVKLVLILGLLTAFGPLSMDMYLPALPNVAADLYASTSMIQLSLTTCLVGLGVGQLVFGPLSDIHGRRKPLLLTITIYVIASLMIAWTMNIVLFILLRFVQGFTAAAGIVIARASARDLYVGKELTKFIALLALVNGAAPILAPVIGGFVLNFTTWIGVFYVLACIGLLMLVAFYFYLPETLSDDNRADRSILAVFKTFNQLLTDRYFMGIALTQGFVMASMFAYIAGSPFVLQNIYGMSPQQFSFLFALNGVGIVIAAQMTGRLSSIYAEKRLLAGGVFISLFGSLLLLVVTWQKLSLIFMSVALFLIVSSVGIISTTSFSLAMEQQGKSAGSASAFLGLLPFVGGGIVSPLVGILGDMNAKPMAVVIFISIFLALVSLFAAFIKRRQTI